MGRRERWWSNGLHVLLVQCFLLVIVRATLVPVSLGPAGTGIWRRDLKQHADLLRPRHEVELHYASESPVDSGYLATVSVEHHSRPYVLVEGFEDLLSAVECASDGAKETTHMALTFHHPRFLAMAKDAWRAHESLLFITHHQSCNEDAEERAVYGSVSIQFEGDRTAVITCRSTVFGPDTDTSTSISVRGGVIPEGAKKTLKPRTFGQHRSQKRAAPSYKFSLDTAWDKVESILRFQALQMSCIDCRWTGEIAAGFNFRISNTDQMDKPQDGTNPPAESGLVKNMEAWLEVTREIKAYTNLELQTALAVKLQYPGLSLQDPFPELGKVMQTKRSKRFIKFGMFSVYGTFKYGVSVSAEFYRAATVRLPMSVTIPANQGAKMNIYDPLSSTSSLKPVIDMKRPELEMTDPETTLAVAFGVGLEFSFEAKHKTGVWAVSVQAGIELPEIETTFIPKSDVNEDCKKPGPLKRALQLKAELGLGLKFEAWLLTQKNPSPIIRRTPLGEWQPPDYLHRSWQSPTLCFGLPDPIGGVIDGLKKPAPPPPSSSSTPAGTAEPPPPSSPAPPPPPSSGADTPPSTRPKPAGKPQSGSGVTFRVAPVPYRIPSWGDRVGGGGGGGGGEAGGGS